MWDNGAIDPVAKTIRLRAPFPADMGNPDEPNGAWPAGHPVSNTRSGMTHQYCLFQGYWPTSWTERQGTFSGIDATGTNSCAFRPGTAYMRPHILAHNTIANGTPVTVDIANVRIARNP